jgi:hypothetical protein
MLIEATRLWCYGDDQFSSHHANTHVHVELSKYYF